VPTDGVDGAGGENIGVDSGVAKVGVGKGVDGDQIAVGAAVGVGFGPGVR
jgi:hypothetical protein